MKPSYKITFLFTLLAVFLTACGNSFSVPSYSSENSTFWETIDFFEEEIADESAFSWYSHKPYERFYNKEWTGEEGLISKFVVYEKIESYIHKSGQSCESIVKFDENNLVTVTHEVTTDDKNWINLCANKTKVESVWTAISVLNDDGGYTITFEEVDFEEIHYYRLVKDD